MVVQKVELLASGGNSDPNRVFEAINSDYSIGFVINPNLEKDYDETTICFLNPKKYGFSGVLEKYNEWVINFLENEFDTLAKYGLTTIELFFNIYFIDQCNFEILDASSLKKISRFDVSIPVSVYNISKTEIIEMLIEEFEEEDFIDLL